MRTLNGILEALGRSLAWSGWRYGCCLQLPMPFGIMGMRDERP